MRSGARLARWVAAGMLVLCGGVACGDDDDTPPTGAAGSGDAAGEAGNNGADGGVGGAAGGVAGESGAANIAGEMGTTDQCVTHDSCAEWGANFGCPATLDDVVPFCGFSGIEILGYASSCGGTVLKASNGGQSVRWTFDEDGKLIGMFAVGDSRDCDQWGEHCEPIGKPTPVCGEGDQGGAGGAAGAVGHGGSAG